MPEKNWANRSNHRSKIFDKKSRHTTLLYTVPHTNDHSRKRSDVFGDARFWFDPNI